MPYMPNRTQLEKEAAFYLDESPDWELCDDANSALDLDFFDAIMAPEKPVVPSVQYFD